MINVPFVIDKYTLDIEYNRDALKILVETLSGADWLEFLLENAKNITYRLKYCIETMMYDVNFQFYLEPKFETMYRLKFH